MSLSMNIKRVSILALSVLFAASIFAAAMPNQIGMVFSASDTAGLCDESFNGNQQIDKWDYPEDFASGDTITADGIELTVTVEGGTVTFSGENVTGVDFCIKEGSDQQEGPQYFQNKLTGSHPRGSVSNIVIYDVIVNNGNGEVDFCDPSQRPAGVSIAKWLQDNNFDGAECFDIEVVKECGSLNVSVAGPKGISWGARWVYGDESNITDNFMGDGGFPATFAEGEGGGSVDATYYLVGGEKDYLVGFDLPNWWDRTGETLTIDTNCEIEEEVYRFQFDKEWTGDVEGIDLDAIKVAFVAEDGKFKWTLGVDAPVVVEPGETTLTNVEEVVSGLPTQCSVTDSTSIVGDLPLETLTAPKDVELYGDDNLFTLTVTNTIECDEGEVLADTDEKKEDGEILAATTVRSLPETGSSASIAVSIAAIAATSLAMASSLIKSAFVRFTA